MSFRLTMFRHVTFHQAIWRKLALMTNFHKTNTLDLYDELSYDETSMTKSLLTYALPQHLFFKSTIFKNCSFSFWLLGPGERSWEISKPPFVCYPIFKGPREQKLSIKFQQKLYKCPSEQFLLHKVISPMICLGRRVAQSWVPDFLYWTVLKVC